ncbi:glutamate 5-kinase [Candidatus Termititenax persephonae]|uniref:Glutamate 5-kinase n=1 Tax=Candidatus Termititenax persephonae TaxID=2218525 RepID=A0A388TF36_9BACT|nr:glutamate 5-kinase [Candidatus Termititenax persephonae]
MAELLVIKIGSNVLTDKYGRLDKRSFRRIAKQVKELYRQGNQVVLVSSGAVVCGMERLRLDQRQRTIPQKQAAAAVGQTLLMNYYAKFMRPLPVGQVLLTAFATANKERSQNLSNTINQLLKMQVIPIINENDSVVVEEIKFGDNDTLSAQVAVLLGAAKLLMLTDIDGLYDSNPRVNPRARLLRVVAKVTPEIVKMAGGAGTHKGTGGMFSKVQAARLATAAGVETCIVNGLRSGILPAALRRTADCTWFKV